VHASGFVGFDELNGGFSEGQSYLIHGSLGSGKTSFALQFLLAGLHGGEPVALVTRRAAPVVLEKALAFGFDLKPFVRDGSLALFEYAPRVIESCARMREEREIVDELQAGLGSPRQRLVLDPATPLLAGTLAGGAAFRARALTEQFGRLGATTLLLCDTPGDMDAVAAFRDLVYGSLRFEAATDGQPGRLVPEQLPGGRLGPAEFAIERGVGLVPASAREASHGGSARTLLLIVRDAAERERLAGLLAGEHRLEQVEDAASGLARMSASPPDLVLVDKDTGSIDGADFCRKLRASGVNVPIVLLSDRVRRVRDRVALLAAGADECLERPLDPRLLRLKVSGLLSRYDGKRDRLAKRRPPEGPPAAQPAAATSTPEAASFTERVERELELAPESGLPFSLVALRPQPECMKALSVLLERLVREYDLVWLGAESAVVLLAETDARGAQAYLDRLAQAGAPEARITQCCFDPALPEREPVLEWLRGCLEATERPRLPQASNA
jgi:DNA-binding response OmpR family regulator/KaiC/GvpD/RAD55 family RecA-like ATPase